MSESLPLDSYPMGVRCRWTPAALSRGSRGAGECAARGQDWVLSRKHRGTRFAGPSSQAGLEAARLERRWGPRNGF